MPYIPDTAERRSQLINNPFDARNGGELNFVFSNLLLSIFKLDRRYETIHKLKLVVNQPSTNPDFENMFYQIPKGKSGLSSYDVRAALDNAWSEFYDRVVRYYEDKAIKRNGDIYTELFQQLDADEADRNKSLAAKPKVGV